jgi:hypothetical protein
MTRDDPAGRSLAPLLAAAWMRRVPASAAQRDCYHPPAPVPDGHVAFAANQATHTGPVKLDFKRSHESYRARSGEFRVINIPAMQYWMVDVHGYPNTSKDYADALAALYPVAYKLKFASKRVPGRV